MNKRYKKRRSLKDWYKKLEAIRRLETPNQEYDEAMAGAEIVAQLEEK